MKNLTFDYDTVNANVRISRRLPKLSKHAIADSSAQVFGPKWGPKFAASQVVEEVLVFLQIQQIVQTLRSDLVLV